MFIIVFKYNSSPKFNDILAYAKNFSKFEHTEDGYKIQLDFIEIFEKWKYFNKMFWRIIELEEMIIIQDEEIIDTYTEKKEIFNDLQFMHWEWINNTETKLSSKYGIPKKNLNISEIDTTKIDDKTADLLIDFYLTKR